MFFLRVNDTGRNFRLLTLPDDATDLARRRKLLPHRDDVFLEDSELPEGLHDRLSERAGGLPRLALRSTTNGKETPIAMPEPVYSVDLGMNEVFDADKLRFGYQSLVTPATVFELDLDTNKLITLKREEIPGGYDPSQYEQTMLCDRRATARISRSALSTRKTRRRPGPQLLFSMSTARTALPEWVWFDSNRISLLDRGVDFAIAHVRGGGETRQNLARRRPADEQEEHLQ